MRVAITHYYYRTPSGQPVATIMATDSGGSFLTKTGPKYVFTAAQKELAGLFPTTIIESGYTLFTLGSAAPLDDNYAI